MSTTKDLQFQQILSLYGISIHLEPAKLFEILATEAHGHMDVHALARGLLQMRGSKQSIHPVFVRHDLNVNTQEFKQKVHELSRSIPETHAMEVKKCEQSMMDKLLPGILELRCWTKDSQVSGNKIHCLRVRVTCSRHVFPSW